MKVERHIFGSQRGYTTLAQSAGVGRTERKLLESFGFGQTSDSAYRQSLLKMPAFISRPAGSKLRAVTRVLPGQPDDQGRDTLLFISAVLQNADWIRVLKGDVQPLLSCANLWEWDGQEKIAAADIPSRQPGPLALSYQQANEMLGLISEIERLNASAQNIVFEESRYGGDVVRAIQMLVPDRVKLSFSCAARTLSANLDVNVNCIARGVGVRSAGPGSRVYRPRTDGLLSPYAAELLSAGLLRGEIPWDVISSYRTFGAGGDEPPDPRPNITALADAAAEATPARTDGRVRTPMRLGTKAVLVFATFIIAALGILGWGVWTKAAARRQENELKRQEQRLRDTLVGILARLQTIEARSDATSKKKDLEKVRGEMDRLQKEVNGLPKERKSVLVNATSALAKAVNEKIDRIGREIDRPGATTGKQGDGRPREQAAGKS